MSGRGWYWRNRLQARLEAVRPDPILGAIPERFAGATALEIGGPSPLLGGKGRIPVYPRLANLDCANYAETTVWDGGSFEGILPRRTFVAEAVDLGVPPDSYDAVLASHVIEHLADPIRALREWTRVLKPDGAMLLVVPHRDGTFDHRRPITRSEHLRADAESRTGEDDLAHLGEVLRLHDLARDPGAKSAVEFAARSRDNARFRALHHHVYRSSTVAELCVMAGLEVELLVARRPFHIVCLASSTPTGGRTRSPADALVGRSPFPADRTS